MPWQHEAARIALARDDAGRYLFRNVVITVPRQSGKTTLLRAIAMQKMMSAAHRGIFYSAQTGKDAGERWRDLVQALHESPFRDRILVSRSAGRQQVTLPNESFFRAFAPTAESLHGYTPNDVLLDEAFAHDEKTGDALMGAILPAMATVDDSQLFIVSTRGTAESVFLNRWIGAGLNAAEGVALIDYGADDGVDAFDPEQWWNFHPALGYTIGADALEAAANSPSMPRSEFERAYANRTTQTLENLIPFDSWDRLKTDPTKPPSEGLVLSFDVAFDSSAATIVGTWSPSAERWSGLHHQVILERHAGTDWLVPAILKWRNKINPRSIVADDAGAVRGYFDELDRRGVQVERFTVRDLSTAYSRWLQRIETATLSHEDQVDFWESVANLATRTTVDGVAPSRRHSAGPVDVAIAAIVGSRHLETLAPPQTQPRIYAPGMAG